MDISKYFESIDHQKLLEVWCRLLSRSELPPDHAAVFKNITSYRVVDRDALYERLGFTKRMKVKGVERLVVVKKSSDIPTQICSNEEFRSKIAGKKSVYSSLIEKNELGYGIPQGAPISDVLANMYLLDFDVRVNEYAKSLGGIYRRYSDDILIIVPSAGISGLDIKDFVKTEIEKHGAMVKIHDRKCYVSHFERVGQDLMFSHVFGKSHKTGLEFLGFRFDGRNVFLRDSTMSGFYRKVSSAVKQHVHSLRIRYRGKDMTYLRTHFNAEEFMQRFGRVEDFDPSFGCRSWTFWTYVKRSQRVFGQAGFPIYQQLRGFRKFVLNRIVNELS